MSVELALGSLAQQLKQYAEGAALLLSAGPVSDAFIMSNGKTDLINGPVGSGKTTAEVKRALRRAIQQPPLTDGSGLRRYVVGHFRATYAQLWSATIPSWKRVLDPDKGVGHWVGASPRNAEHVIHFEDAFGPIELVARFAAFGEDADADDLGGFEFTDACLGELPTLPEELFTNLRGRVGRDPARGKVGLANRPDVPYGAIYADCNAPAPDSWVYRDFWGPTKPPSYRLFRQPGGMEPEAENLAAVGREYYAAQIEANRHRPWWIKTKIFNEPGYSRETDVVFEKFVESRHVSPVELKVFPEIPVMIGVDGGLTPAAAFLQNMPDGEIRILAEVPLDRGDELDLARHINELTGSPRFAGCEFHLVLDPSEFAGDDTTNGSRAKRLGKALSLVPHRAPTNEPEARHKPIRGALERNLSGGRPGLLIDGAHCFVVRRGFAGTFQYRRVRGTDDRSNVIKNPDSHVCEAAEYASLTSGTAAATQRQSERDRALRKRREEGNQTPRQSPFRQSAPASPFRRRI